MCCRPTAGHCYDAEVSSAIGSVIVYWGKTQVTTYLIGL